MTDDVLFQTTVQDLRTGRNIQHDLPALLSPGNVHIADRWKELTGFSP